VEVSDCPSQELQVCTEYTLSCDLLVWAEWSMGWLGQNEDYQSRNDEKGYTDGSPHETYTNGQRRWFRAA
jgi:hypothetical protein